MDNNNEPPVQQNNQSLETQVASLTQQVALLTQLLLQQQSNQQQAGASSTIIQSEQISSSSLTPPPQVTPKTEQKSPARETRVCKECQDTEKPLYRHYELCKQCHNRSSKKRRRDEIQNDDDRFVNYCHQAAEIPRRIRRSMEEPAEVDQTNQADLEERHRQAVTSDESDESDEEQKYPMTEEKFKKFYGASTEAAYNSRGIEICVDCAKPEIAVASSHRCRKCHSRYVEERYRCNPKNYKTRKQCKAPKAFHQSETAELCYQCTNGKNDNNRLKRRHSASPTIDRASKLQQDSNDSGGSEYEETDSNESEESSGSEFDGSDESEYDGSAQSESRNSNNFASPTPRKLNKHHGNFKPTVRHTPMSQEEFDRVFVNATFESRFNSHGKRICLDCNSKSIKSLSRCLKCLARYNLERRRADPQHYRLCPMCKEVCWHQSMSIAQCAKCYQWLCEQNINNTVRATRHSENLNNTASATQHSENLDNTANTPRIIKRRTTKGPMTKEEFERAFPDEEPAPKYNQRGQEICLTCGTTDIKTMHRCLKCYCRYSNLKNRSNPENYRKCRMCNTDQAWHHSKTVDNCRNCYQWIRNNPGQNPILHAKKHIPRHNSILNAKKHLRRKKASFRALRRQKMTKEEFERAFPDEEPAPKYNQSGQEVCFDCESTQIMGLHRCVSCYYRYTEERRYSNPKNYYKCRSCKTPNAFHQGKNSSECKNCRQNALNELRFSHKRLVNQNTSSQQQHLNQSPSLEELYEEPLVVSKKEDCDKFRVGWARIRRQIIMRRFHLKIAEEIREQRRHERQKRREERRNLIQPNRSSSFDSSNIVVPSNPANWIPEGWRKGQCKVCRVKLNGSIRDYCCPNFCRTCGNRYLRQRVCIACKETKRHHGKGLCKSCYNDVRYGRVQNPDVQTKKANGEGHSTSMQAKRVKGEEVSQMNENFLANNEHNQMGVNTVQNVPPTVSQNNERTNRSVSPINLVEFEEPEVIDLTLDDD